jgi:hypothetical protein
MAGGGRAQDHDHEGPRETTTVQICPTMRPAIILVILAALFFTGCQQPAPPQFQVEQSRSYNRGKQAVWNDILAFLRANDIAVTRSDFASGEIGAVRLRYQDAGWADCEPAMVTGHPSGNRSPARARIFLDRSLTLRVDVREAGGMVEVAPDAQFSERQINMYKNLPFDVPCRSTGVLEKALLDAI